MVDSRVHQEVFHGRVHPILSGFTEKDIWTPRGEGLVCCWELVNCGGKCSDVVKFLRVQNLRLGQRVTAIVRTKRSTWVLDVTDTDVRITHFRVYAPRATNMSLAMKRFWEKKRWAEKFPMLDFDDNLGGVV